nr:MAG TPA: hypothetical protein [Bacteriophage sp.]
MRLRRNIHNILYIMVILHFICILSNKPDY